MVVKTIYMHLLNEGTDVFRPIQGEMISEMIFRILPAENVDMEDENWAFPPGNIVLCENRWIDGKSVLAVKQRFGE